MAVFYVSPLHVFSVNDLTSSNDGDNAVAEGKIDFSESVVPGFVDKSNNTLFGIDSTFGFYVRDFVGAEPKDYDGDFAEGWVGNLEFGFPDDPDPLPPGWVTIENGLGVRNSVTDVFLTGAPLGTWQVAMGGQSEVKASTEHYSTMAALLSDQKFPGDPDALRPLDDDLRILDYEVAPFSNATTINDLHLLWLKELTQAMQAAIDNVEANGNAAPDIVLNDIDFNRNGLTTADAYRITKQVVNFEGAPKTIAAVDIGNNGSIDMVDGLLNGFGSPADITDIIAPNEANITSDIAFGRDYSVTVKDDGKLLYRWGEAYKRPNDVRMEVDLDLPTQWTADANNNNIADGVENGGFVITRAELIIRHDITNNPNDQIRPEDYENEGATGRIPSHYIIRDPDNPGKTLWVSPVNSYTGTGEVLPSYLVLDGGGNVVNTAVAPPNSTAVFDPDGVRVGYRNNLVEGTILKSDALAELNMAAGLSFTSSDLAGGFTDAWYTTVNREPFEWSYDPNASPYINVYQSYRSPEEAAADGMTEDELVSGPRWRLTPNKFGQDLPGLEVPLEENSLPPYQRDNIKYPTGEFTITTINLLDWNGDSPLDTSLGWMTVDKERLDENSDGLIDEGWTNVNGSLGAGDALPAAVVTATTPNGVNLDARLDVAVYVKGDRQDDARLYDIQLVMEYEAPDAAIGTVQMVAGVDHNAQTVSFLDGTSLSNAVVFAMPPTFVGADVGSVTISNVSSTSATIRYEEADYLDGIHYLAEEVSLLALEAGSHTLSDGSELEVGKVNVAAGPTRAMKSVTFSEAFDEAPIVLAQLQTDNGDDWAFVRVRNVTATGFEFAIQEQENSDGLHAAEVVGWMAIDAAAASDLIDWGGVAAQAFVAEDIDHTRGTFAFDASVGLDPLISAGIGTYSGADPAVLRLTSLSDNGTQATAEFLVQEDKSLDQEIWHLPEDIYGLAFEQASVLLGVTTSMAMDGMEVA